MDALLASFGLLGPLVIFAVIWALSCLKVINEYERAVVFTLGKVSNTPKGQLAQLARESHRESPMHRHMVRLIENDDLPGARLFNNGAQSILDIGRIKLRQVVR